MDRLITREGGFPLNCETLEFIQKSYTDSVSSLTRVIGDKVILEGVTVSGGNHTAGSIIYNGEVIPFTQSPTSSPTVFIVDVIETAVYETDEDTDGNQDIKDTYYRRYARTVALTGDVAVANFPFSDLKTVTALKQQSTPLGGAILWFDAANIPAGWRIMDGTGGTVNGVVARDLRNMFIKMAGTEQAINTTSGSRTKVITNSNLPPHSHTTPSHNHKIYVTGNGGQDSGTDVTATSRISYRGSSGGDNDIKTSRPTNPSAVPTLGISGDAPAGVTGNGSGTSTPMNIEPLHYAALWIQFIGI